MQFLLFLCIRSSSHLCCLILERWKKSRFGCILIKIVLVPCPLKDCRIKCRKNIYMGVLLPWFFPSGWSSYSRILAWKASVETLDGWIISVVRIESGEKSSWIVHIPKSVDLYMWLLISGINFMNSIGNKAGRHFIGVVLAALQLQTGHSCSDALAEVCGWP